MLELSRTRYESIIDHAREGAPREVCGVLAGTRESGSARVEDLVRTENVADYPRTTYRIDPEELFAVVEDLEEEGREVLGFYHSHPEGPRRPSRTDVARATWTDHIYLLVSLDGGFPFFGAWVWDGDEFVDEVVRVV